MFEDTFESCLKICLHHVRRHVFTRYHKNIYTVKRCLLTFEIEPKQGNVENVNLLKNERFIFYWILVLTGSNS